MRTEHVDIYSQDFCRVWLLAVYEGRDDLEPRSASRYCIGSVPDWYGNEDIDIIIGPQWKTEESGEGWVFASTWFNWLLRRGLAPGQAFLLHIDAPTYYRTSWEYDEWDADWHCEILQCEPWSPETATNSWERVNTRRLKYKQTAVSRMRELNRLRKTDTSAMYLVQDRYYAHGYHEDMWPDGAIVKLCTRHTSVEGTGKHGHFDLLQGRDDNGNFDKALKALERAAMEHLQLPATVLEELPYERRYQ